MIPTVDAHPETDPILSPRRIAEDLGVNLSTVWRWQRAGIYPPFLELGPQRAGQLLSVHEAWKKSRPRKAQPATAAAA